MFLQAFVVGFSLVFTFPDFPDSDHVMHLHFSFSRTVQAHSLRVPFPVLWNPHLGAHAVAAEVTLKRTAPGLGWVVPAETLFSVDLAPGIEGCAAGTLTLELFDSGVHSAPDWTSLHAAYWTRSSLFGRALAQQMFIAPAYPWNIAEVSRTLGEDIRTVQMRLFREAYSFTSTLRRCRMLRVLLSTLSKDAPSPKLPATALAGSAQQMDSLFEAVHQTRLSTIERSRLPTAHDIGIKSPVVPGTGFA